MFFKSQERPIVISIGGSLIVPNGGPDSEFLKKLNIFVRKQVAKGKRFFLVAGGGKTARHYIDAGRFVIENITSEDMDWLGIHGTHLNGHLLRTIFSDIAHPRIIQNYEKKLNDWKEPVVVGAGWKPGWSTDYDATILARDYGANLIINLSNVDWVYDKDPRKNEDAKPIKRITWEEMERLIGTRWTPGLNAPFDPVAAQLGKKLGLTVIVTNGKDFSNLEKIINGEQFKGTVIMPFKIDAGYYDREYYSGKKGEHRIGYTESFFGRIFHSVLNYYRALLIKLFLNPKNCLDVGCGTGDLVRCLRLLGIEAYGIEISKIARELADKHTKQYIQYGDIVKVPFSDDYFDLVITFDVLEHLERSKIKKALEEVIRVSRKYILHKIYTEENDWITFFHAKDHSHISVFSKKYWAKLFSNFPNISILRGSYFRLPGFFETVFLLKKKA